MSNQPNDDVRQRVLDAVRRGDIVQRRSRLRWLTSETEYRILTGPERKHLSSLLRDGDIRFVSDANRYGIGHYEIDSRSR